MRLDDLFLCFLGEPSTPRYVGALKLIAAGKGVSLRYDPQWLANGFALSEDLPLVDTEFLPLGRLAGDPPRAVGAVDDARPDRWGEKVIRFVEKPQRLSLMEYLYYAGDDRFGALGVSTSFGLLPAQAAAEIAAVIEVVNTWQAHFAREGVTTRDIDSVAERIDGDELLAQRKGFDRGSFHPAPTQRKRLGPFRR